MKTKFITFLLLIIVCFANAQENICAEKEKQFRDFVTAKDFTNANLSWLDIREKCAKYNEDIYKLANEVLNYNIEIAPSDKKEDAVRELLSMFKKYDAAFPSNSNANGVKSAMALYYNRVGTSDEILSFLDASFTKKPEDFKDPSALYVYFKLFFEKFKEGKSGISADNVLEKYSGIRGLVFQNTKKYPEKAAEYNRVNMATEALVSDLLTCENLTPYFERNFEKNKNDMAWLLAAATTFAENCKTSKMFETIALQLDKLNPTSDSSYFLGEYYLNTRNQVQALNYFDKSAKLASGTDKANKAYTIASIVSNSDKAKAKEMVQLAIQNDPATGKYYFFLANLYVNSLNECATSQLDQAAIYKLAANVILKAGKVEERLKQSSEKTAAEYLSKIDKKSKGKSVKLNCWINENVQL